MDAAACHLEVPNLVRRRYVLSKIREKQRKHGVWQVGGLMGSVKLISECVN